MAHNTTTSLNSTIPIPNTTSTDIPDLPQTMRAWQWTTCTTTLEDSLTLNPTAALPPSPLPQGSYLIRVHTASLNPVDYKLPSLPLVGRLLIPKPATPGLDFTGTIVQTTPSSRLGVGTRVFGKLEPKQQHGTLAEYIVGSSEGTVELPDGVGWDEGAGLGVCGLVVYQALVRGVKSGDRVFVNGGSGGTGTLAVQVARALGCTVVTSCSGANVQLCKDLGADQVIDYRKESVTQALAHSGEKFDFILDNVGEPAELYWNAPLYTKPGAKYVQIGSQMSFGFVYDLAFRFLVPTWLGGGRTPFSFAFASTSYEDYGGLMGLVREGKVKPVVDEVLEFERVREGYEKLRTGRARGKIVVRVAEKT